MKTEADHLELGRLEFLGSLYLDATGVPAIPGRVLYSSIRNAARKDRKGKEAETGIRCPGMFPLVYSGPRDPKELWEDETFRSREVVRVKTDRIVRTRPIFHQWSAEVTVEFNENIVNPEEVLHWLQVAGTQVGLGDWRTGGYGLFTVEDI